MRKVLIAAAGIAALAAGGVGFAFAQGGSAEAPRAHQGGFFQADANSDGAVTRQEYDAAGAARFATLDANNDGQLTREERRAQRGERRRGRGGRGGGMMGADANNDGNITREEFLARPTQMFDRLDADDDGVISASERPQRRERGERGERPARVNPDTNNDGQLSRAEYAAMGATMFERLDANNDGRVTQEEATAARQNRRGGR
jgi:hypothetical protein